MYIQTSKLELVRLILNIKSQDTIDKILNVLKSEKEDFGRELRPQEREEIELGIKQLEAGQRTSLEDFIKKVS